jgi:50S ribosomal subunit-associated GTPase HflX
VLAEDMLFATLDSTTRRLGCLRDAKSRRGTRLHQQVASWVVEAFKSTLDEVNEPTCFST